MLNKNNKQNKLPIKRKSRRMKIKSRRKNEKEKTLYYRLKMNCPEKLIKC